MFQQAGGERRILETGVRKLPQRGKPMQGGPPEKTGPAMAGTDGIIALLSAIVDSSDDAIVSKTLDGIITSWNRAAEKMFGYSANEVIGRSIRLIIPPELQAEEDYVLGQIRRGERVDHYETVRQAKNGRRVDISLTVSPIRNAQGEVVGASKIARDITDQRRMESLLREIIGSSDDAIVTKDLNDVITSWNGAAEKIFGYSASEAIGRSIRLIIPPELQAEEDYVLGQIRRGERVRHYETLRRTKDGRRLNVSLTVSPIRDARGVVVGASKIARNITEKKQLEVERDSTRAQLVEALAARDEFIAVAAHELRNPINVMVLLWQLLNKVSNDSATSAGRKLIDKSRAQLARLSSLVDRLLDVTQIRSGKFDLCYGTVDLISLIHEVISRFTIENPAIRISLQHDQHIEGVWDRVRIDQVVTNLVSNAIKYGGQKPITINASADGDHAIIIVRDQGIGISCENLDRIFVRFERVTAPLTSQGLGMGLWITKQIVEAHGGSVVAESHLGKGSTFTVRLPFRK
jgi:PAS domain S-box-containing protein